MKRPSKNCRSGSKCGRLPKSNQLFLTQSKISWESDH